MNRYLLFAGRNYYPSGGWSDYVGSYVDTDDAAAQRPSDSDWAQIVDTQASPPRIVARFYNNRWHAQEAE